MQEALGQEILDGEDPEAFWKSAEERGCEARVGWSRDRRAAVSTLNGPIQLALKEESCNS